jgi:hypothetical protein
VLLALVTTGAFALLYVLLWWMLPQETLAGRRRGGSGRLLLVTLLIVATAVGWLLAQSGSLTGPTGQDLYWPVLLLLAGVINFLLSTGTCMKIRRQTNLLWGIVLLIVSVVFLLRALGQVPDGIFDLIIRAWPALLVLAGLSVFLRGRVPLGSGIAFVLTAVLVGSMGVYSFSTRSEQQRDDNHVEFAQPVGEGITLLRVRMQTLTTRVDVVAALQQSTISGDFIGSTESEIEADYVEAGDGTATFTLRETRPGGVPRLDAIGRGALRLELPPDIPTDLEFIGAAGDATLDARDIFVERLNINLAEGDALVTLPEYDPQGSSDDATLGGWAVLNGDITVVIPPAVAAHLELDRGLSGIQPQYDPTVYNLLATGTTGALEARNFDSAAIRVRYNITAPRGQIRLQVASE